AFGRSIRRSSSPGSCGSRDGCSCAWSRSSLGFFFVVGDFGDPGGFAAAVAQVIELGAADAAAADDLDRIDVGRIEREDALDALAEGNLADGERRAERVAALAGDADAFVVLHARARAFRHLVADADGVARLEVRDGLAESGNLLGLQFRDQVHRVILASARGGSAMVCAP